MVTYRCLLKQSGLDLDNQISSLAKFESCEKGEFGVPQLPALFTSLGSEESKGCNLPAGGQWAVPCKA